MARGNAVKTKCDKCGAEREIGAFDFRPCVCGGFLNEIEPMTYQERPKGATGAEASLDGGKTWRRCVPISFTAENAQKCFDGVKTQTRRLVNPQPNVDKVNPTK